jgi:hypothetical protein
LLVALISSELAGGDERGLRSSSWLLDRQLSLPDVAVMGQPVERRSGHLGVAKDARVPLFLRVRVSRHDHRPASFSVWHRLEALVKERSGRGPAYVVVALPDGRPRAVRIGSTDLGEMPITSRHNGADLQRISARTLIPLMGCALLDLVDENVIHEVPTDASRSGGISPSDDSRSTRLSDGRHSAIGQILATLLRRMQKAARFLDADAPLPA